MSFDDFIILRRIAKNEKEYILQVLELNNFQKITVFYDRDNEKIKLFPEITEEFLNNIIRDFIHHDTPVSLSKEYLMNFLNTEISKLDSILKIHRFDRKTRPALRKFHYSIKNSETRSLFIPCCGKHIDHDNIKNLWGKYINNFEILPGINIEGYQVFDIKAFDMYITYLGPAILDIKYIGNSGILLKEFLDYVEASIPVTESDPVVVVKYASGREIELNV